MPHLLNIWPAVSRRLANAPRVLLIFDYDGTLTPILARPELALLPEGARQCLIELAVKQRFVVGVVSGRALAELKEVVAIPGLVYAGNHGLEMSGLGMDFVHPEAFRFIETITKLANELEQELKNVPRLLIQDKKLTLSVHLRNTPDCYAGIVDRAVTSVVEPYSSAGWIKITRGKKVIEVRPNIDWGKGEAIEKIRQECGDDSFTMFFGDDQTDEGGFAVVQNASGIAVYIGPTRQQTKALHQLESPKEVEQVLALLAESDP